MRLNNPQIAARPATEITQFFGQNTHDSGNDALEKTIQNNAAGFASFQYYYFWNYIQ